MSRADNEKWDKRKNETTKSGKRQNTWGKRKLPGNIGNRHYQTNKKNIKFMQDNAHLYAAHKFTEYLQQLGFYRLRMMN